MKWPGDGIDAILIPLDRLDSLYAEDAVDLCLIAKTRNIFFFLLSKRPV